MATLYYNNADSDGDWDNLNNWWDNSAYTASATSLPTYGDIVYIDGEVTNGPTIGVTLDSVICGTYLTTSFNVEFSNGLATTNGYTFSNNANHSGLYLTGLYSFYDSSVNSGTVNSNGINSTFNDSSSNSGTVVDSTSFYGNSQNIGTCDEATFNDSSNNVDGSILGDAIFQTFSIVTGGTYTDTLGYGTGVVNGNIYGTPGNYIYTIQYNSNDLTGNIVLAQPVTVEFVNSTRNRGYIDTISNTLFSDSSYNIGTIETNALFIYTTATLGIVDDITGYASGTVNGATYDTTGTALISAWRFSTTNLVSGGICKGNAIFKSTSVNRGTVTGNAYFDASSIKASLSAGASGAVGGNIFFPFADILGTGLQ